MSSESVRLAAAGSVAAEETLDDLALVARAQGGDTEAFSLLVERHQHRVYNLAYRFMRDAASAEDMAQEAFIKAFRLLRGFRGECHFSTWLYRVAVNVCLTELGRRAKRQYLPQAWREAHPAACAGLAGAAWPEASPDIPELIRGCVAKLPERYRAIITLYYLDELPYEEIADIMEIPMGTLKTWMHRARRQLKNIVEQELHIYGTA